MISPLVDDKTPPGITPVQRKTLRSHYTLPQNELMKNPILDTMLVSQCSSATKSMDRTLSSLQGHMLEAIRPLSQLPEAINDEDPQISMDQIGEAVETALTLLANASLNISEVWRTKVLKEYNKELLPFATAKERDWASGAPRLFGPNFLKEATDYLQQLQLLRKAKEKSVFQQTPLHNQQGEQRQAMASTPVLPFNSAQETASWEENLQQQEMTSNSMHTQCRHFFRINTCCQSYVGQSKGHGVCVVTSDKGFFNGSRQAGQVCQHLEGVTSRQLGFTDCQRLSKFPL